MSFEAVGSRYAQALFDIGVETGRLAKLADEICSFADTYAGSDDLRAVLGNPLVSLSDREALLAVLGRRMGLGDVSMAAIRLLASRNRLVVLPTIARALRRMSDEKDGVLRATVVSAMPLSEAYARRLQQEFEKLTGSKVLLTREVDASLIAGVVTKVGDTVIDGSLRSRLNGLRGQLLSAWYRSGDAGDSEPALV